GTEPGPYHVVPRYTSPAAVQRAGRKPLTHRRRPSSEEGGGTVVGTSRRNVPVRYVECWCVMTSACAYDNGAKGTARSIPETPRRRRAPGSCPRGANQR